MPDFVEATLNYADPNQDRGVMYEAGLERSAAAIEPRKVRIYDGRQSDAPFSLERNGFKLIRHAADFDLTDKPQVNASYGYQMRLIVKAMTGASKVLLVDQAIRSEAHAHLQSPAHGIHVDSDVETLRGFVRKIHPGAEPLLAKRYAMINLWRPLSPVERSPLAVCDASTVACEDLRSGRIDHGPAAGGGGHMAGFTVVYNRAHRWWTFPGMQPDEVLVFKLIDSDPDAVQFTAHTAFDDPGSPADAAPRLSIESRTLAFFD